MLQAKRPHRPLAFTRTIIWVLVFVYGGVLVAGSTYQNYAMNRDIIEQRARIATLEKEKQELELALIYYRSNAFKEIEARRRLNLKGPDEHVVVLSDAVTEAAVGQLEIKKTTDPTPLPLSPAQAWWNLFFGHTSEDSGS